MVKGDTRLRTTSSHTLVGHGEKLESVVKYRLDVLRRWRRARADGLTAAQAAAAVNVSRATLYRWARASLRGRHYLKPRSRRPIRARARTWGPELVRAVRELREQYKTWGKFRIAKRLAALGYSVSESMVGRILSHLFKREVVGRCMAWRPAKGRARVNASRYAERLTGEVPAPTRPGDRIGLDTLEIRRFGYETLYQFTACDLVSRWACAQAFSNATALNAAHFLDKLRKSASFPIESIQVDGGSEFMGEFEEECKRLGIKLWVLPPRSPKMNAHVERMNGTWRREFYESWHLDTDNLVQMNLWIDAFAEEFNHIRPHHALAGLTPQQYLDQLHSLR